MLANAVRPYEMDAAPFMWDVLGRRDEGIPPYGVGIVYHVLALVYTM